MFQPLQFINWEGSLKISMLRRMIFPPKKGLCNSTSKGFSNLNGFQFLRHFIKNIQIGWNYFFHIRTTTFQNKNKNQSSRLLIRNQFYFMWETRLEAFLAKIEMSQLLPGEIVAKKIRDKLNGLCSFGKCNRLRDSEGINTGFDLFLEGIPLKGFVECKGEIYNSWLHN